MRRPPRSTRTGTLFPYTTLFRSTEAKRAQGRRRQGGNLAEFADRQDFEIRIGKGLVDPDLELAAREVTRTRHMAAPIGVAFAHVEDNEIVALPAEDRKSTRLNSSHSCASRMPSSA